MTENPNSDFLYRKFRDEHQDQVRRLSGHTHLSAMDAGEAPPWLSEIQDSRRSISPL